MRETPRVYAAPDESSFVTVWDECHVSVDARLDIDEKEDLLGLANTISNEYGCKTADEIYTRMGWERIF